jgi:hypothetical protein
MTRGLKKQTESSNPDGFERLPDRIAFKLDLRRKCGMNLPSGSDYFHRERALLPLHLFEASGAIQLLQLFGQTMEEI